MSWTIKLSKPGQKQIDFFDKSLGGESQAAVSVLRDGHASCHARLVAQGEVQKLEPYFGQTVEFALEKTIPVKKGYVIALTVPTWAPALAVGPRRRHVVARQPRKGSCDDSQTQTAQAVNQIGRSTTACTAPRASLLRARDLDAGTGAQPGQAPGFCEQKSLKPPEFVVSVPPPVPVPPVPSRRCPSRSVPRRRCRRWPRRRCRSRRPCRRRGAGCRSAEPAVPLAARGRGARRRGAADGRRRGGRRRACGGGVVGVDDEPVARGRAARGAADRRALQARRAPAGSSGRRRASRCCRRRRVEAAGGEEHQADGRGATAHVTVRSVVRTAASSGAMRRPHVGQSLRSFCASWSHQLQKRRFSTAQGSSRRRWAPAAAPCRRPRASSPVSRSR